MKRNMMFAAVTFFLTLSFCLPVMAETSWEDAVNYPSCPYCGMDRQKYARSRVLTTYDNKSVVGFCSIHCAAAQLTVELDKSPLTIEVGDYKTHKLIDAEKAFWVIGGSKPGVMTKRAKWAFATKKCADKFIKEFGGEHATFDQAMEATYQDMYHDSKMIRERRKMKRMRKMKAMKEGKKCAN